MLPMRIANLPGLTCLTGVLLAGAPALAAGEGGKYYPGDLGQAIATILTFVILLLILRRWAWRPVVGELQRREHDLTEALRNAQRQQKEAGDLLDLYKARLDRAQIDADELLAESRKQGVEIRAKSIEAARAEAKQNADRAKEELEHAKTQAICELRQAAANLASEMAGRIIRRELSPDDHRRLLADSLQEIEKEAGKD